MQQLNVITSWNLPQLSTGSRVHCLVKQSSFALDEFWMYTYWHLYLSGIYLWCCLFYVWFLNYSQNNPSSCLFIVKTLYLYQPFTVSPSLGNILLIKHSLINFGPSLESVDFRTVYKTHPSWLRLIPSLKGVFFFFFIRKLVDISLCRPIIC